MQDQLAKDLKAALLSGDKTKVEVLKSLKNALQYEAVAQSVKPEDLSDDQIQKVLAREAKKRAEAVDLYEKAGEAERAAAENAEKAVIDAYLPEQVDETAIEAAVKAEIAKIDNPGPQNMGQIIGVVRQQLGAGADGATIARIVKENLQ